VTNRFYIGAAANFAEGWLDWRFDYDTTLREDPSAAQAIRLRGFGWGIGFSVGILARPVDRLWLGLSYVSHIFNPGPGPDFPLADTTHACIGATCGFNDRLTGSVPDILMLGIRGEITSRLDIEGQARWVHYGNRPITEIELQGGSGCPNGCATSFLFDRGFQDAWGLEVSARWRANTKLRLSPSLFYESAAVDSSVVDAANLDAHKLDVALTLEYKPVRHLVLGLSFGVTMFILQHAGERFDPQAQLDCMAAQYSLDACQASNHGDGWPSAAGKYTLVVPHAGGALGVEF
jgi:long-subunit fatty acid transport protein